MRTGLKLVLIGALLVALMVPMLMLRGLVWERQQRGLEAAADIARSGSREQHLVGPLLLVDAEETLRRTRTMREGDGPVDVFHEDVRQRRQHLIAPDTLTIDNRLTAHERRRGLFGVQIYTDQLNAGARFTLPAPPPIEGERIAHRWLGAALIVGVGDARGIQRLNLRVDGREQRVEPGSRIGFLAEGVHAPLDVSMLLAGQAMEVEIDAQIQGSRSLQWSPLAGEARVSAQADWPHPGFVGQRLPDDPSIDSAGFSATWTVSRLSSQSLQALARCEIEAGQCAAVSDAGFGVRLVDPVDRYLKTERAIKYALLLLVLVFGAVFFLEALRGVEVHPLQYGLTGIALAMFFLLLLSLSEHIGFGPAYALAASACVGLIAFYMEAVLGSRKRGMIFGLLVAGLYGLLYGLLQSEDYALLTGSLALFALLAGVMLATRRLDWRRVGQAR
ncbi:cell envelope integrity protein CreD [Xanthomonadaceae bacterium JHOS43]|nr:cell envelope integrity protein CreD [Xanthomonadaceae bacterium JHOS43]MCX7562793.1 cell envelope integrity protein CreD [Xanthomonadaceae bacterium XH05]